MEAYNADSLSELEESGYILLVMDNVRRYLYDAGRLLHEGLDICSDPDGPAAYDTALRSDIQMIEELRGTGAFTELGVKMNSVKWMRLAANRDKTVSEEKAAKVKAIREEVKGWSKIWPASIFIRMRREFLKTFRSAVLRWRNWQALSGSSPKDSKKEALQKYD